MKPFTYWLRQAVEEEFGIKEVRKHPLLEKWLAAKCEISEDEKQQLKHF